MKEGKWIMTRKKLSLIFVILMIGTLILGGCGQKAPQTAAPQTQTPPNVELPQGGHVKAVSEMPSKPLRLAFLSFQNNPFWYPVRDGATAAKDYLKNYNTTVDYIVMGDDLTAEKVVSAMETAIAKKYDGIVVVPIFDGTETVINKAVDAGIPVFNIIAQGSKPSKAISFMGQDATAAGQVAGEWIEKLTGGEGKYGVITGVLGATQHELRKNGAIDYLKKAPNLKMVGVYENKDKAETAYSLTKDMLTAHPDLKVVYVTAGGPFGAAKAIKDLGKTGQVKVVCYDWIPENVEYVRSGEIAAAVSQDPFGQGFDSLVSLYNNIVGKKTLDKVIPVLNDVLTPENVNQLLGAAK